MDDYHPTASTSDGGDYFLPPSSTTRPSRNRAKTAKARGVDDDQATAPKLRVKIGTGGGGAAGGGGHSGIDYTGIGWDRELDSDPEEPLAVEEHFILRVPPHLAPQLREQVENRNVPSDVWFKFKDSRRAVFHTGDKLYGAKLVDLPALVESQRTMGTGGQTVKIADISQMLLVEEEIKDESQVTSGKAFNIEDFIFPHGITPPLKHVRKRRFRKRVNKRTIEAVEDAVERLLEKDTHAEEVKYELLDHDVLSDDEYGSPGPNGGTDSVGAPTPLPGDGGGSGGEGDGDADGDGHGADDDEDDEEGSGYDSDLANEINKGLEALNKSGSESGSGSDGEGGLFGSDDDDDDEDEDEVDEEEQRAAQEDPELVEMRRRVKLLQEETGDLDKAIAAKEVDLKKAMNPLFKKRIEEMIKKLTVDRDLKKSQHATAAKDLEKKKAGDEAANLAAVAAVEQSAAAAAAASMPPPPAAAGAGAGTSGGSSRSASASVGPAGTVPPPPEDDQMDLS